MPELNTTKETIQALIKKARRIQVFYDNKWRYIFQGATQKTCPMLDMCFKIEKQGGYVIWIPEAALKKPPAPEALTAMNGKPENVSQEDWENQNRS